MQVNNIKKYAKFIAEKGETIALCMPNNILASSRLFLEFSLESEGNYLRTSLTRFEGTQLSEFLKSSCLDSDKTAITLTGQEGERLTFRHSNLGEPYREGIEICVEGIESFPDYICPFVQTFVARKIGDHIAQQMAKL